MTNIPEELFSIQLERATIGGLINNQDTLVDLNNKLSESDFYNPIHANIFLILRNLVLSGNKVDKVILGQKIKEFKISKFNEIDIFDYLDNLSFTQITKNGLIESVGELNKLRIKRELWINANEVQRLLKNSSSLTIDEIVSNIDTINNSAISKHYVAEEPIDIYAGIEELIRKNAKNQMMEVGLITPFPIFNNLFGGLISRNGCYNIISRSGEGKSTFLFNMGKGVAKLNNVKVLYLDTEMSLDLNMYRAAAAEIQLNSWYLRTGQWASKGIDLTKKVNEGIIRINARKGSVYHMYVPNKDIKDVLSIIRRWYYKYVGRGNKALIIYDYLKITSDLEKNRQEWQQLGDKISYLNELGYDLDVPVFTAGQQNRSGEQNGVRLDDSTTAGASDRINQYACFNAVFRMKTDEEIGEHGPQYGTHLLKPFKYARTQGKEDYNKHKMVKIYDQRTKSFKYKPNFIGYEISEYELIEKNTYADIVKIQQLQTNLQKDNNNTESHF